MPYYMPGESGEISTISRSKGCIAQQPSITVFMYSRWLYSRLLFSSSTVQQFQYKLLVLLRRYDEIYYLRPNALESISIYFDNEFIRFSSFLVFVSTIY